MSFFNLYCILNLKFYCTFLGGDDLSMKDTLLITGNGFDLALGLKSNYRDFFNEYYKNFDTNFDTDFYTSIVFRELDKECRFLIKVMDSDFKNDNWKKFKNSEALYGYLMNLFSSNFNGKNDKGRSFLQLKFGSFLSIISYFYDRDLIKHFDLIFSLLFLSVDTNHKWFEVENNLKNMVHIIYSEYFVSNIILISEFLGSMQEHVEGKYFDNDPYNVIIFNFFFTLSIPEEHRTTQTTIYSEIQDKNEINSYLDFFNKELKKFECKFSDFLSDQIKANNYEERSKELLSRISQATESTINNETTNILNFNYTNFFKDYNTVSIHGSIDNKDIIFGFDENGINDYHNLEYQYTKTYQVMARNVNSIKILNNDINKIIIYGHSLSEADYSYFESIFDYCYIYDKPIDIYFCYPIFHKYDEKTYKAKTELQNAVINLIKNYGNTFDNKDHGKNLLHKLLIENRIHLAGVDQLELSDSSQS